MPVLTKKERALRLLIVALGVALAAGMFLYISKPLLRFLGEPEQFRAWIEARGLWGVLLFALMNMLQVFVAVIPGGPFSIAAGYAFGPTRGILICLAATSLASLLILLLVQRFGAPVVRYLSGKDPEELKLFQNEKRLGLVMFLIYLVPGSPKDLLCYAAGLSKISAPLWLLINLVGRLPGIALTVLGGDRLMSGKYLPALLLTLACTLLYAGGMIFYRVYIDKKKKAQDGE